VKQDNYLKIEEKEIMKKYSEIVIEYLKGFIYQQGAIIQKLENHIHFNEKMFFNFTIILFIFNVCFYWSSKMINWVFLLNLA
jgi:hypothetical protein